MSSKDIMDLLKRLAANAGLSIKQEFWNSYDDMNKLIVDILCLQFLEKVNADFAVQALSYTPLKMSLWKSHVMWLSEALNVYE